MLREAPASPPIMSQGSYLRVSSFPRGFHPPTPSAVVFPLFISPRRSSLTLPPSAALPRDSESPFSPRYFIAPRSPLRVLYLLVFSGFVFISNAASRMRNVRHVHVRIYKCKYMYVFARIHMWKLNACGPFWRLCERRHACGTHPRHFSLSLSVLLYLSSPSSTRNFSTPDRER